MSRFYIIIFAVILCGASHAGRVLKNSKLTESPAHGRVTKPQAHKESRATKARPKAEANNLKKRKQPVEKRSSAWLESLGLPGESGLYATRNLKNGEIIGWYSGANFISAYDMTKFDFAHRLGGKGPSYIYDVIDPLDKKHLYFIDAYNSEKEKMCLAAFANHMPSEFANCDFNPMEKEDEPGDYGIALMTKRDIAKGTEIIVDYGSDFEETLQTQYEPYRRWVEEHAPDTLVDDSESGGVPKTPTYFFMALMPALVHELRSAHHAEPMNAEDEPSNSPTKQLWRIEQGIIDLDDRLAILETLEKSDDDSATLSQQIDMLIEAYNVIHLQILSQRKWQNESERLERMILRRLTVCYWRKALVLLVQQRRQSTDEMRRKFLVSRLALLEQAQSYAQKVVFEDDENSAFKELRRYLESADFDVGEEERLAEQLLADQNSLVEDADTYRTQANELLDEDDYMLKPKHEKVAHREIAISLYAHALYLLSMENFTIGESDEDLNNFDQTAQSEQTSSTLKLVGDLFYTLAESVSDTIKWDYEQAKTYSKRSLRAYRSVDGIDVSYDIQEVLKQSKRIEREQLVRLSKDIKKFGKSKKR